MNKYDNNKISVTLGAICRWIITQYQATYYKCLDVFGHLYDHHSVDFLICS